MWALDSTGRGTWSLAIWEAEISLLKHIVKRLVVCSPSLTVSKQLAPKTLGPIEAVTIGAVHSQRVMLARPSATAMQVGHGRPLTRLLRAEATARAFTPSRLTPPRISAHRIGRNFFSSTPARRLTPSLQHLDKYTPPRLPNAEWPYLYSKYDKMANLDSYFQQVDSLQDKFIDRLREAVAIPSISSEDQRRPDVVKVRLARSTSAVYTRLICTIDGPLARGPDQGARR